MPTDLFLRLPNLKWLDVRNNQIPQIPADGLDKHASLRYLLLGGNLIRTLPVQLGKEKEEEIQFVFFHCHVGKVKGLSALNLDGNPLDHPPFEIVKQGIKAIQQYLRDQSDHNDDDDNNNNNNGADADEEEEEEVERQTTELIADVWASSDEENPRPRQRSRSPYPSRLHTRPSVMRLRNSKYKKTKAKSSRPFNHLFLSLFLELIL